MVQIIEEYAQPGMKERFTQAFSNLGQAAATQIPQYLMDQQKQQQNLMRQEALSDYLGGVDPSLLGDEQIANELLKSKLQQDLQAQKYGFEESLFEAKEEPKRQQENVLKQVRQNSLRTMFDLSKDLGRGTSVKAAFGGQTARKRGQFKSANAALESALREMINPTGAMSDTRFKYITKDILPSETDTIQEIRGKLLSIGQMLGLDTSFIEESFSESGKESRKSVSAKRERAPQRREGSRAISLSAHFD